MSYADSPKKQEEVEEESEKRKTIDKEEKLLYRDRAT
jgi:hypothetical protein